MNPTATKQNGPAEFRSNGAGTTSDPVQKPRVAVLMAVRDGERFLSQQLDSLARQKSVDVDLWISDDGSSDGSIELIRRVADSWTLGRLEVVDGPRRGFAENFRSLIVRAEINVDFLAFCDQDDLWDDDKLAHAIEWLKTQPVALPALYCSRTRIIAANGEIVRQSPRFPRPPCFRNAIVQSIAGGNTMVMNRAAHDLVAEASRRTGFVSHDWWCYMIVSGAGGNVCYCAQPRVSYRQHDGNLVGENNNWRARMSRLGFLMRGRFREWNDRNLSGLTACADLLTDDARRTLELFIRSREGRLTVRLRSLWRSGAYRQTVLGEWGLYLACIVRRL